ncbi:MAG TPA: ABC transporter ATP-binding protein [Anaerolineae bacterium]
MLTIEQLDTGYGTVQALWGITLEVREGEIVALIGSNGAGKTTLLTAISGLLSRWRGRIVFNGRDFTHGASNAIVAAGIVQVPQGRRLFAGLSVRENLMQGAFTRRDRANLKGDLDRVVDLFPALGKRMEMPAGKLSGGEQQMVAIGRGIMARPKLLMIDEMSLGLAPLVVDAMISALETINREQGTALLLVEQDVQVALEHAHRGYVIETGHIVLADMSQNLLANPHIQAAYLGV